MKRRILLLLLACAAAVQCSHPYTEGMTGSFPTTENLGAKAHTFSHEGGTKSYDMVSNSDIEYTVEYGEGDARNWLKVNVEPIDKGLKLSLSADKNERRESRSALVNVYNIDDMCIGVIEVAQTGYSFAQGQENVYDGDLVLATQDEIDNCVYTKINGKLIIGALYSGSYVSSLENLNYITEIRDGLVIRNCNDLRSLGPLASLTLPLVHIENSDAFLVDSWKGNTKELILNKQSDVYSLENFDEIEKLTINDCGGESFGGLESLSNVKEAAITNNKGIYSSDQVDDIPMVEVLDLSGNPIMYSDHLADETHLKKLNLSNTNLSNAQVRYLKACLPATEIIASSLNSTGVVNVSVDSTAHYSASLTLNVNITDCRYIYYYLTEVKEGYSFNRSDLVRIYDLYGNTSGYALKLDDLEPNKEYALWVCAEGERGRYLSEELKFETKEIKYYTFEVQPTFPVLANAASYSPSFPQMTADVARMKETGVGLDSYVMNVSSGKYSLSMPEGKFSAALWATSSASSSYVLTRSDISSLDDVYWSLDMKSLSASDVIVACYAGNLNADVSAPVTFVRPVAKIDMTVDFSQSLVPVSVVKSVKIELKDMYQSYRFGPGLSAPEYDYYTSAGWVFEKSMTGVSGNTLVLADDMFVMPHRSTAGRAAVTVVFTDGTTYTVNYTMPQISAGNAYDIAIPIAIRNAGTSFTVDVIVDKDDNIEL